MILDTSIYVEFIRIQELIDEYTSMQKDSRDHFTDNTSHDYILKMSTKIEKDDRSYENTTDSSGDDA